MVDSDHRCPFPAGWSIAASPHSATNILDDNTANIPNRPPLFSKKKILIQMNSDGWARREPQRATG